MPLPNDTLSLSIGGVSNDRWLSYEIDSDLLTPADAWHVSLGGGQPLPSAIAPGADCLITLGKDKVMVGVVDEIAEQLDKRSHSITLSGRDLAGQLLDCSAPLFNQLHVSLLTIVQKLVTPLNITTRIDAASTDIKKKVSVTPGSTAWEVLQNAAEANGLWPWFDPTGVLILGRPDSPVSANAMLILSRDQPSLNNVLSASLTRSAHDVFSEVRVLGQSAALEGERAMRGVWGSASVLIKPSRPRLKIITDYECNNSKTAKLRANKELNDGLLNARIVTCTVRGHRTEAGLIWTPGMRVSLKLDALGINGEWLLMRRKLRGGGESGTLTELTLYEDGLWQIDAHPHQRVQRKAELANHSGVQP